MHWAIAAAFAAHWAALVAPVRHWWRSGRRWTALAVALGVFALCCFITRGTVLRGGYADDHEFGQMSLDFFSLAPDAVKRVAEWPDKHMGALPMLSLFDTLGGHSLAGVLAGQKALWLFCGLLLFGALRKTGFGLAAAAAGAAALCSSFLVLAATYSFSTVNAAIFYVCSAIYGLASLMKAEKPRDAPAALALFLTASALVWASRFEFLPALIWGFALALWNGGASALARAWRRDGLGKAGLAALTAAFAAFVLGWLKVLVTLQPSNEQMSLSVLEIPRNVAHHLGAQNLSPLTGAPPEAVVVLAAGALALSGVLAWRARRRRPELLFWAAFLAGWILYFAVVYAPDSGAVMVPGDRLFNFRHDLYFFVPFAFLAGLLVELTTPAPAALAAIAVYAGLNVMQARALQADWRTNDKEWQFLYNARRDWPAGCRAVYPAWDHRGWLLHKYFPFQKFPDATGSGCYLLYRSPQETVFVDRRFDASPEELARLRGPAWREETFAHRPYTNYPDELKEPVPVTMGFYRLRSRPLAAGR